jgi:NhaP-type Na+/H+ or K+/H+ antiporter
MDETIIFLVLLPAILFTKGFTFKKGAFIKNLRFIVLFGIVGTFILYIVITLLVYAANELSIIFIYHRSDA